MGLTYNITEDYLYQEGQKIKERDIVIKMLKDKTLSIEKIADLVGVTVGYVKQIEKEMKFARCKHRGIAFKNLLISQQAAGN